uniref:Uncharacterized protein n=1 Tax=Anguilla anguilla TaxID=7936 RepID=A0A0E9U7K5_ANGAN
MMDNHGEQTGVKLCQMF